MAMTAAGMAPAINGNTYKARSPSSYGKPRSSNQHLGIGDDSWGFNPDGDCAHTGGEDKFRQSAGGRKRSPVQTMNPYIEMRRKRADTRMVRYQLANMGANYNQQASQSHASMQNRLRTPDRQSMLNISQVSQALDHSVNSSPALSPGGPASILDFDADAARAHASTRYSPSKS